MNAHLSVKFTYCKGRDITVLGAMERFPDCDLDSCSLSDRN